MNDERREQIAYALVALKRFGFLVPPASPDLLACFGRMLKDLDDRIRTLEQSAARSE